MPGTDLLLDLRAMMPTLFPAVYGLLLLIGVPLLRREDQRWLWYIAVGGMFVCTLVPISLLYTWTDGLDYSLTAGFAGMEMVRFDPLALWLDIMFAVAGLMALLVMPTYLARAEAYRSEIFPLMFFAVTGMTIMVATESLVMIFIGLEVLSIALYVMTGIMREKESSVEAALKYFLLGAFSTGFLVYGIALVYGATGRLDLAGIGGAIISGEIFGMPMLLTGMALILVAFSFKIGAVPFHFWAPDVYQGAPTPVTAFMAAGTKAAAFGVLIRLLHSGFSGSSEVSHRWVLALSVLAVLTMLIGNLLALVQVRLKRLLAYSSVAHAGYLLLGLLAPIEIGVANVLFYLLAYTFMTVGAFIVIALFQEDGEDADHMTHFSGLFFKRPVLAVTMGIFLLSLTGIPPLGGFVGKYEIFLAALSSGHAGLAIVMGVAAVIGAAYYLRVIVAMFFHAPERPVIDHLVVPIPAVVALAVAVVGTLVLGLAPSLVLDPLSQVHAGLALLP